MAAYAPLLARAHRGECWLVSRTLDAEVTLLGARQRRRSELPSGAGLAYRRATTGPAATLRGAALWFTLALPSVDALAADATPETLLNRNVRPFLRAFSRFGPPARYHGRDCIKQGDAPVALLGYALDARGAVLVDVILGCSRPALAHPGAAAFTHRGKGLDAVVTAVEEAVAAFGARALTAGSLGPVGLAAPVTRDDDPVPAGYEPVGRLAVPIGAIEAWRGAEGWWLGGDALCSTAWLEALEGAFHRGAPLPPPTALDGAKPEDYLALRDG